MSGIAWRDGTTASEALTLTLPADIAAGDLVAFWYSAVTGTWLYMGAGLGYTS